MFKERRKRSDIAKLALLATTIGIVSLFQSASPAFSEEKAEKRNVSVLDEIVVTSQKREQLIQDVGLAVTAFSGDQMRSLGMTQSVDIARMTPGVFISSSIGGQMAQFTIRGVTQNDFTDSVESPIAVYVDEGYVAMQQGQTFAMFDVDRVEVIKGPQSTLFGRNATGGVVHYITRKPTKETEGFIDLSYGRFNKVKAEAALGGSLGDHVMGRVSVIYTYNDPFLKNQFPAGAVNIGGPVAGGGQDLYDDDTIAGRAQLLFELNDDAELLLSGFGAHTKLSESPYQSVPTVAVLDAQGRVVGGIYASPTETREGIGPNGTAVDLNFDGNPFRPVAGGDFFGYVDPDGAGRLTSKDFAFSDLNEYKTAGATAKLTWGLGDYDLVSITDFKHFYKFNAMDVDAGPADQFNFASESEEDSFTQEVRVEGNFDNFRWITGLYYLHINNKTDNGFLVMPSSVMSPLFLGAGVGADLINRIALKTNSYSFFGQVEYDLSDTLTFTVGGRLIREEKDYNFTQGLYASTNDLTIDTENLVTFLRPDFVTSTGKTLWAGKAQLDWRPNDDILVYASINRGVKAGSFNAKLPDGSPPLTDEAIPYGEEVLVSYEVGFKATVLDGKARINGSAYYYDYNDYQAAVFANVSSVTENVDSTVKGFELEILANPADGLDVMFGISALDAEIGDLEVAPGVFRDVKPAFTPDVQLSGLVRYEFQQEIFGGYVSLQADANYISSFFHNPRNFDSQKLDGYVVTNARVNWNSADAAWSASVFVDNVLDETYTPLGFDVSTLCGCTETLYGKPRWWGISVRREF